MLLLVLAVVLHAVPVLYVVVVGRLGRGCGRWWMEQRRVDRLVGHVRRRGGGRWRRQKVCVEAGRQQQLGGCGRGQREVALHGCRAARGRGGGR